MSPVKKLIKIAKSVEPRDGYYDAYSLVDALEANPTAMAAFRLIFASVTAEDLDPLETEGKYGHLIGGAADELDLLPDDPRLFTSKEDIERIPAAKVLGELCSACILNDTNKVEALAARIDVNQLDHNKQCPLCYAVGNNHVDCVQILLRHGADPNRVQNWGNTPLHICATCVCSKEIFQILLNAGGDLTIKNDEGKTPVDEMGRKRRREWLPG